MRIFRMAMSAIEELSAESLRPGPIAYNCVMLATAATRVG